MARICHALDVRQGLRVGYEDPIGLVGATGLATGPHVHLAIEVDGGRLRPEELRYDWTA